MQSMDDRLLLLEISRGGASEIIVLLCPYSSEREGGKERKEKGDERRHTKVVLIEDLDVAVAVANPDLALDDRHAPHVRRAP